MLTYVFDRESIKVTAESKLFFELSRYFRSIDDMIEIALDKNCVCFKLIIKTLTAV